MNQHDRKGTVLLSCMFIVTMSALLLGGVMYGILLSHDVATQRLQWELQRQSASVLLTYCARMAALQFEQLKTQQIKERLLFEQWPLDGKRTTSAVVEVEARDDTLFLRVTCGKRASETIISCTIGLADSIASSKKKSYQIIDWHESGNR